MKVKRLPCSLTIALAGFAIHAQADYDKVLYLDPPLATSCLAVAIATAEGQPLSGLRWFHNDDSVAFPKLVLMEGEVSQPPDLANTALVLLEISGASLAWGVVDFGGPVTSSTGMAYAVFFFPEGEATTGLGSGPGIGIREDASAARFYLSGDGENWVQFERGYGLGIEPVYASGKTKPRLLKQLKQEILVGAPDATPAVYETALLDPRPNPFNPRVEIAFTLSQPETVELVIFDLKGRLIATLLREMKPKGVHKTVWEGKDVRGHEVASGTYFARLTAGQYQAKRRLALLR